MSAQGRNSAVVAGLAASLGIVAALYVAPAAALADEAAVGVAPQEELMALPAAGLVAGGGEAVADGAPAGEKDGEAEAVAPDAGATLGDVAADAPGEAADTGAADPSVDAPVTGEGAGDVAGDGTAIAGDDAEGADEGTVDAGAGLADEGADGDAAEGAGIADDAEGEAAEDASDTEGDAAEEASDTELMTAPEHANSWVRADDGTYQWYDASGARVESGWVVTDRRIDGSAGDLQRYWIDGDSGSLAFSKLINVIENGLNYWSYATDQGYVVRGKYATTDAEGRRLVYLADNDGRLAGPGWVVSDAYGDGVQRYWVDEESHAAVVGRSGDGWEHYTTEAGYVLRGKLAVREGDRDLVYLANNDGLLASGGWVVSDAYGDGMQRYWVDEEARAAVVGYSPEGWEHYTTSAGYVLRGALTEADGTRRWANNDGLLVSGWVVTGDFTGGALQRYWQQGGQVVRDQIIDAGGGWFAYASSTGEVARGAVAADGRVYLADNDGRLVTGEGWLVTDAYGDGVQRYFLVASGEGYSYAQTGFFESTIYPGDSRAYWFYGDLDRGYVARGKTPTPNGLVLSNNDGILAESLMDVPDGMWVTDEFDDQPRRYFFERIDGHLYARTGVFTIDGNHYFGLPEEGYLAVGRTPYGRGMIIATDEGVLLWQDHEGWLVTDAFDGEPQRYYFWDLGGGVMGARTGLFEVDGSQYYGRDDTGYVVRGSAGYVAPDGRVYYADNDGKLAYPFLTQAGWNAWERIKGLFSWTKYLIAVDPEAHRTVVFQGSFIDEKGCFGNWSPIYDWSCGTGRKIYNGGQGTLRGTFTIGGDNADYNWAEGGYTPGGYRTTYWVKNDVRYFTGFVCNLGFHSTVGIEGGYSDLSQLGRDISHGCVRLLEANARWIYDNALPGTKVVVF